MMRHLRQHRRAVRGLRVALAQFRMVGQMLRQRHRIQDQHDVAGAQHRGAGNADHARQLRAHDS
jgi:hypothetical protein